MSVTPQRIVCLTAEAADWLWRIGAWDAVAGVTAYFEPPPEAAPRPRVSGFSSANVENILKLQPDLVIAFSDVQAEIAAQLILRGCTVLTTNQRTLAEIEATLRLLARVVGREAIAESLLREFREGIAPVPAPPSRPRVYFEEWSHPPISGIAWVSELIERAGGEDIFSALRPQRAARDRTVKPEQIIAAAPELIFASWCGEPVDVESISRRAGWDQIPAVRHGRIYELAGADILQPGFGLLRGYEQIKRLVGRAFAAPKRLRRRRRVP